MIPEAPSSAFYDRNWELQRPWLAGKDARAGDRWGTPGLCFLLAVATFLVYAQACRFGYVQIDDPIYVSNNRNVQAGLTVRTVVWSFTTFHDGDWLPLTWLSLMADSSLYGEHPGAFHFTNILLHTLNTLLLFAFLLKATGQRFPSALVAALFALHPLHVESVAWISERKDVLSTFFGLLSLLAYVRYARRRDLWSLAVCFLLFGCSLLAKQTLVTLPCVFLLLDYWPLHRLSLSRLGSSTADDAAPEPATRAGATSPRVSGAARLLLEKVPFLMVSAAFCVIVMAAQSSKNAVQTFTTLPLPIRLANAAVAYVGYLEKTFYPHNLAVYYPHRGNQLGWSAVCVAATLIVAISACAIVWSRRHPYLFVGWAWYLGTLVPMLGIIQVGGQQMADRYTYFPSIGIFIAVVWTVRSLSSPLVPAGTSRARMLWAAALVILAALAATTCWQVACWRDDMTLLTHAIASADDNWFIRNKLGCALSEQGKTREAIEQFELAARLEPKCVDAEYNQGAMHARLGEFDQAIDHYRAALAINDGHALAHNYLGFIQGIRGQYRAAKSNIRRAIEISPDFAEAHANLGLVCLNSGDYAGAISNCQRALELQPNLTSCHCIIARALSAQGRTHEAISQLESALAIAPGDVEARNELARMLAKNRAP
jgi:protein O-mannosyl-transferase